MMTSRFRATVRTETGDIRKGRVTASDQEISGFLQEVLRSCGKQSSAPSCTSIIRDVKRAAAVAAF
ncbi:hypothetical protein EXN66_Car010085 [Channa argus]|uniref:Uncharacterized protein n=1 Tax=Channa argus TaxID=215402 RepID=A0A6G1PVZ6_CHAAH|nr:hypothetical protein EXN66_Car010085 [Channa argus]